MTVMVNCSPTALAGMRRTSSLAESAAVPWTRRPLLASTFTFVVTAAPFSREGTGSSRESCGGADGSAASCASDIEGVSRVKASTTKTAARNEELLETAELALEAGMAGLPCENNVELRHGLVLRAGIVHRFRVRLVSKVLSMISGSFTSAPIPPISLPKPRSRYLADCGLAADRRAG